MQNTKPDKSKDEGFHQTDLAEGELETIEESIRIHERKKDVQGQPAAGAKKKKTVSER